MKIEDPACCGSGCTNCVLDVKPSKHALPADVTNVFDRTYKTFVCEAITQATTNVFLFRFRYVPSAVVIDRERLIVPPGCHLMLRTLRTYNSASIGNHLFEAWREESSIVAIDSSSVGIVKKAIEKHDKAEDDLYFSRPYTPIAFDPEQGTFDVLIKLEPGGLMSNYLATLTVGCHTEWKGVYGDFLWQRNQHRTVVAFVQGVAIAPVYSTLRAILDDDEDETRLMLCACFRDLPNVLLRDDLHALASYWNFKYAIYLSRRSCACHENLENCTCNAKYHLRYNEPIYDRRLEAEDIERLLGRALSDGKQSLLVLLCGTVPFTAFIKTSLAKMEIENCYTF
ncbi:NADH-cytochrome b5 reductase-like [Anopheles maculipalpis]|uniref:NADH-cytochrome b5 reductase-like n=1 Tax=Anopheles maculipalpis TaxID=1496333 RepID=UPI002158EA86|nr:NADH-cytochrome b5 reductase-like [Anopheles maculipalpis]